jgi:hypothetical protein
MDVELLPEAHLEANRGAELPIDMTMGKAYRVYAHCSGEPTQDEEFLLVIDDAREWRWLVLQETRPATHNI